jgi:phenylacetic acid degradation operon negative regulatory protein
MTQSTIPALRSQDVVFTLFGDYLLDRDRPTWTGSLITLLGELGLSPMAVRTVLSRMVKKGWLTVERRGTRSWHGLTKKARRLLEQGSERIYHRPASAAWDGAWSVVTYTIPEDRRTLRDALRVRLQFLGCGPLSNGLWLAPHDVEREVRSIAAELRIERYVEVFRGAHAGFSGPAQLVRQCWDLQDLNRRYAAFTDRWQLDFDACRLCGRGGGNDMHHACAAPAACFRRRFLLVHEYRAFLLDDPLLPRQLLPEGWKGETAARLFEAYHDMLAAPAERYVADVCREGDALVTAADRNTIGAAAPLRDGGRHYA